MQLHALASGSTGNCLFVKMGDAKLLVDVGISTRRITSSLAQLAADVKSIDAVFITHEHRDHIKGLTTLVNKYKIPVYATYDTWKEIKKRNKLPPECCNILPKTLFIKDVQVESFAIPHDAADPVGYNFYHRGTKCSVVTDLGFVTDNVKNAIANADYMVFEANHDVDMLRSGSYPWYLKQRILSNKGHLSNVDAGWTLARMPKKDKLKVLLAHISQENNCPELAKETVSNILRTAGYTLNEIEINITYPDKIASIE